MEYRPNVLLGLSFAVLFAATAVILVWLGFVLRPADRAAMDGPTLILFTAVPIRLFSWCFAAIFMFFAFRMARRCLASKPTLVLAKAGLTLPSGKTLPWARVVSANTVQQNLLTIEVTDGQEQQSSPMARRKWPMRFWSVKNDNRVVVSAFELGADPASVATELEKRKAEALREAIQG